jgi:hypothetical protein
MDGSDSSTDDDPESTASISQRWIFTNDVLAFILLSSLPILTALGATQVLALGQVPALFAWTYATGILVASVWAFGKSSVEAVSSLRSK